VVEAAVLTQIDDLQSRYMRTLDRRAMDGWAACFDSQASYVCIARENEEQNLALAIMMDDNAERIRDRVTYVTKIWVGVFEDYTTRHFVQRVECQKLEPSLFLVESNFMVAYTTSRGRSEMLVAGVYRDEIVLGAGGAAFRSKRAVLDTTVTPRYLVYPV
jgi:3-phenylpropionate/cinnamic acid dioxygenase small subunit